MNFGKFSGVLGKGDDYYTFKSKFIKAYGNHPKDLKVEWLKNNHLEGLAKEFVGSLDNIDEIWERFVFTRPKKGTGRQFFVNLKNNIFFTRDMFLLG